MIIVPAMSASLTPNIETFDWHLTNTAARVYLTTFIFVAHESCACLFRRITILALQGDDIRSLGLKIINDKILP